MLKRGLLGLPLLSAFAFSSCAAADVGYPFEEVLTAAQDACGMVGEAGSAYQFQLSSDWEEATPTENAFVLDRFPPVEAWAAGDATDTSAVFQKTVGGQVLYLLVLGPSTDRDTGQAQMRCSVHDVAVSFPSFERKRLVEWASRDPHVRIAAYLSDNDLVIQDLDAEDAEVFSTGSLTWRPGLTDHSRQTVIASVAPFSEAHVLIYEDHLVFETTR